MEQEEKTSAARQPKDTVGARCSPSPYLSRESHSSPTALGQKVIHAFDALLAITPKKGLCVLLSSNICMQRFSYPRCHFGAQQRLNK